MSYLSIQVDLIIHEILASLPPGDLIIERAHSPNLISYSLRRNQSRIANIDIENLSTPSPEVLISFSSMVLNEEYLWKVNNLFDQIMARIESETDEVRWVKKTYGLDDSLPSSKPRTRFPVLYEKVCETSSSHFYNLLQDITTHYNNDNFNHVDYLTVSKTDVQFHFCIACRVPDGLICQVDLLPINQYQALIRLSAAYLPPERFTPFEIEAGLAFRQFLVKTIQSIFGPSTHLTGQIEKVVPSDPASDPAPNLQPWEKIPDRFSDQIAVRLWCEGHTNQEIARRICMQPKSVTNLISRLRCRYPDAGIPTYHQKRKLMVSDGMK